MKKNNWSRQLRQCGNVERGKRRQSEMTNTVLRKVLGKLYQKSDRWCINTKLHRRIQTIIGIYSYSKFISFNQYFLSKLYLLMNITFDI